MIYLANDHGGYRLGMALFSKMVEKKMHITHHGCCSSDISTDYPMFAKRVVEEIQFLDYAVGILVCGTGIGMCMAANRNSNVRAAVCHNITEAKLAREHNNVNILCLPGRFMEFDDAWAITKTFLKTPFSNEDRHIKRLEMFK